VSSTDVLRRGSAEAALQRCVTLRYLRYSSSVVADRLQLPRASAGLRSKPRRSRLRLRQRRQIMGLVDEQDDVAAG
jgi:hypothetical protein